MKKLLFIPLMAYCLLAKSQVSITSISQLISGNQTFDYYVGDTIRFTVDITRGSSCPTCMIDLNIGSNLTSFTLSYQYLPTFSSMWDGHQYVYKWALPSTASGMITSKIPFKAQCCNGLWTLFSLSPRPVTTDITPDILTEKVAYKHYSVQGIELQNEPESGLYIQEAILNGQVTRRKIYKSQN